jgi:hypothetical protein
MPVIARGGKIPRPAAFGNPGHQNTGFLRFLQAFIQAEQQFRIQKNDMVYEWDRG